MRDPRYWQSGHPEWADFHAWVGDAFRQLHAGDDQRNTDGLVWVRPYTRTRDGQSEDVIGHLRHAGDRGGQTDGQHSSGRVTVEDPPGGGVDRRYTVLDPSGGLIGRCDRLADGSQLCTLALPDGGIAVQALEAGEAEFTPVFAPAIATYGFPALLGAATALYGYLQNWRATIPPGAAAPDTPFMLFYRGFEGTDAGLHVTVGTLSDERVNQFCPRTAEFTQMLNGIADETPREGLTPQQWGTAVHTRMNEEIRRRNGRDSTVVRSEFSLVRGENRSYGTLGSTRLDIYHRVKGTSTICAYDIKTGQALLNAAQAGRIYREAHDFAYRAGVANPRVLIIELRRTP